MTFEPLIPNSLWLALAVGGAALLAWYALHRPAMTGRARWVAVLALMSAGLGLVLLILLNPIRVREIAPPPGKPLLTVLVDASASMATPDAATGATRYRAAARIASALSDELADRFDVRVRTFSGGSSGADPDVLASRKPDGQSTDIAAAIADNLELERPQGQAVVLLSDGIQNVGNGADPVFEAIKRAKALDAPVYTQTFGGGETALDLAVSLRSPQDLAFAAQRVPVTVQVWQRGATGAHAQVALLYDGKEVRRQELELTAASTDVRFWVTQPKPGIYLYEARVEPIPGEATQANNIATYLLRVIDQPIRVLLLEGKPYWDSKFLVRTLASVPAVELDSVVRVAQGRLLRRTTSHREPSASRPADAPASQPAEGGQMASDSRAEQWKVVSDASDVLAGADRLKQYQVIVLGRDAEAFLTDAALTNLQNWISRDGGSLVCYRGAPTAQVNQGLARLLPVKWTPAHEGRFRVQLTDQGRDLHWFGGTGPAEDRELLGLPTLATSAQVDRSKPLAVVLATSVAPGGTQNPAVVYQPYGSGRTVVIEGAGMWRWAFLPPQFQQREQVYAELWHSLLRWVTSGVSLLPGQRMTLRADKVSFATAEPATATLLVREEAAGQVPQVELTGGELPAPKTFSAAVLGDEPGTFRVNFGTLPEGRYQARIATAGAQDAVTRTVFDVRSMSREQMDLQARPDMMARIASDTDGAVLGPDPAAQLAGHIREHVARSRPARYDRTTAWDRPWVLLTVFAIWGLSWIVRRSGGLV